MLKNFKTIIHIQQFFFTLNSLIANNNMIIALSFDAKWIIFFSQVDKLNIFYFN